VQQLALLEKWQHGTITANEFGNASLPLIQQLRVLANGTTNPSIPNEWRLAFDNYRASIGYAIQAYELEVSVVHQADPQHSPVWGTIANDLDLAALYVKIAAQAAPK